MVLFVHGAGTPAEVAFDVPYQDYSWMAYLAQARVRRLLGGHDRLRPLDATAAMNDPCNLAPTQQAAVHPASHARAVSRHVRPDLTSIASDWDDVGAAVDYIRALRRVERVSLVAWSLGGPRSGGYAAQNPQKVHRLVLLAPGYSREGTGERQPRFRPMAWCSTRSRARSSMRTGIGRSAAPLSTSSAVS